MERFYKKASVWLTLPSMLLFFTVIVIPFIIGVIYSFASWRGTYFAGGSIWESFVGLDNYSRIFRDKKFLSALANTAEYTFLAVIMVNVVSLTLALRVHKLIRGGGIFRTIYFIPNLLGGLALGYIWQFIFQIVYTKILFGPEGVIHIPALMNMTQNHTKAFWALALMVTWQQAGYMMIIYLNGLNAISQDLYEAAKMDGATGGQRFRYLTAPLLMPSFTIVLFLTLSGSFKLLDQNIALTDGDFNTRLLAMQILQTTNDTTPPNYGLAQAQAVVFFVIIAIISLTQVYVTKKREVEM